MRMFQNKAQIAWEEPGASIHFSDCGGGGVGGGGVGGE